MPVQGGPKARKGGGSRRRGTVAARVVGARKMAGMSTRVVSGTAGQGGTSAKR
jgi:hypothetical protein